MLSVLKTETLYRKYRSQRFSELLGQRTSVTILRKSITLDRVHHAYLFSGPRGTGKTSVARIFSKALNCLNPQDGDCCGGCRWCEAITKGIALDVVEMDAASSRGVDDVRELQEAAGYAPTELKWKIFIIDEAHMLTPTAWNAMLKIVEEPPETVIFIFCTTEQQKFPLTILSRCLRLEFKPIDMGELAAHVVRLSELEGYSIEAEAADVVAQLAEGCARDAVSALDQLMVYCEKEITLKDVRDLFALSDPRIVKRCMDALAANVPAEMIKCWQHVRDNGGDPVLFLLDVAQLAKGRYMERRHPAWLAVLEEIHKGINLIKRDNFPALVVELSLLAANTEAQKYVKPKADTTGASNG